MRLRPFASAALMCLTLGAAAPAGASTFTLYGMSAGIENLGLADAALPDGAYVLRLTLDTSGYSAPAGDRLVGIDHLRTLAINFGSNAFIDDATLLPGSPSGWTINTGRATKAGCAEGPDFWLCTKTSAGELLLDGSVYTWLFALDFAGDDAYEPPTTGIVQASVGGVRDKEHGHGTIDERYLSEGVVASFPYMGTVTGPGDPDVPAVLTAVPEPASLVMLGTGLVVAGVAVRSWKRPH